MRTSFRILKRDLLALLKNPIALLVVGALLVLPGLYAWYCIIANWDPYANTGSMPIAVVNRDEGASSSLTGEVNIGRQVLDELEGNDSIDWRFYDSEQEALADTEIALVYATIVLPEDLSANVLGIFEGSDEKPTVYYYPNEKYNAVATKVCDSAAQTLVKQINQGFSSTVNEKVLSSTQKIADRMEERADQANASAIGEIRAVQDDIDQVIASLDDAASSIAGWRNAASGADAALAATAGQLPVIQEALDQGGEQIDALRSETGEFESGLSSTILTSAATVSELSAQASAMLSQATSDMRALQAQLQALADAAGADEDLKFSAEALRDVISLIDSGVSLVDGKVGELNAKVQDTTGSVTSATEQISGDVMPELDAGSYELTSSFAGLSGAIGQFRPQVEQLRDVLGQTDAALETATGAIDDAKGLLSTIGTNLRGTAADVGAIGKALEIDQLSELLDIDPDSLGTFVSSPVNMVTEKVFPVSNYGTAVAPFYTNLALWIGCFILISLMKVEVDRTGFERSTARQRYFGRWLLFVILSLLQSQVICGVDILLGIDCANPALFMLSGAVCSFAYMNLIFALVKTFRNIGKTLCILLLIMQVPGSSGMYPVQMMPHFFQFIHPALPFTYGINAMREALSGMSGAAYAVDLTVLLLIVPVSLLLGLALRPFMANLLELFDEEMRKTGFFASEEHGQGSDSNRLRGMMRAVAADASYRDDIEERAWRFNRAYPRLRKVGSVATFAIPFAFLVLMLPFNVFLGLSVNAKLRALVIMIVLLLVVLFALIVLEYMHRTIAEETKLIGESLIDDDLLAEIAALKAAAGAPEGDAGKPEPASSERRVGAATAPAQGQSGAPKRRGGPARDLFLTDMRLGFQSAIGVVVIMLLVITPSMYAWFNIAGSWDPYGNTGNLKVAVANEDEGYKGELIPVTINIGDTVVSQLRGNSSFDWVFVDADEAVSGVESSQYYAAIVIPGDFSSNMLTYLTDDAQYPDVSYYTNEKENPIAPIITQKGADSIQESIRVSFTERVDEVALSVAYDVLDYVTNPRLSGYVAKMSGHLADAIADARSSAKELGSLSGLVSTVARIVDTTGTAAEGLKSASATAKTAVGEAKSGLSNASSAFGEATDVVRGMLEGRNLDVAKVQRIVSGALDVLKSGADKVPGLIDIAINDVEEWKSAHADDPDVAAKCDTILGSLRTARQRADAVPGNIADAQAKTSSLVDGAQSEVSEAKSFFNDTVAPSVEDLRATVEEVSSSTSTVVEGLEGAVDGVGESTGGLSNQLNALSGGLERSGAKLEAAASSIEGMKQRVSEALSSGDLKQVEAVILGGDPEAIAASLAAPIQLEREAMYPVANYGSSMAPFYTVLSLWVGALVMISTMRVHVAEERVEELRRRYAKVRLRHEFFGRYGIFGFIGLLQSSLVLLGDLLFFHIQCVNPVLFFICGLLIGQAFCLIVYTLTELFGDVGKALCVVLLIMQVAASGGTFPVEMLDPLLVDVVPFLPFYHAMSILQECVAGVDWTALAVFASALLVMVGAMLVIGVPLRRPFRKVNDFFEEQLEKTGYM